MSKKTADVSKRPLYLYDIPSHVLDSLSAKDAPELQREESELTTVVPVAPSDSPVGSQSCSLCSQSFESMLDQRSHLKSDLHNYNLRQKLRGLVPVTEAEFEKLVGDLDESLSGEDSSDSEDDQQEGSKASTLSALLKRQANLSGFANPGSSNDGNDDDSDSVAKRVEAKTPLVWFESPLLPLNTYFGVYRVMFSPGELSDISKRIEAMKSKQLAPMPAPKLNKDGSPLTAYKGPHIFMLMIGGGHFAAMVVALSPRQTKNNAPGPLNREATVLAHKTFHRYTTRRKQGGSQSANDNAKGAAHSAGSTLRRYNEQALVDDVRALLNEWKPLIDTAELHFIRATGMTNRRTLFGPYDGQVLQVNDPRIRGFPFNTRRATQNELMRAFIELTRLKVKEILPQEERPEPKASLAPKTVTKAPAKPEFNEEEETALLHTSQIQALIRRSKLPALLSYFQMNNIDASFSFFPTDQHHHAPTALHFAATQGSAAIITGLLTRANANPTVPNAEGRTAFELAGDRAARDAFRVARSELGETTWDWAAAKVPAPLSKADAEARSERERKEAESKEAERRKTEEARLRRESPAAVTSAVGKDKGLLGSADAKMTPEERREKEARGLTPEMRMRLERERRARAAEARMKAMRGGS
ncbi:hypothetical protein CFIMG_004504RA [Ceratocystis fimbriata CBS 114723]|uniref:VLRF1 domain-containing protein n=2 Tax=Ceratocystis TaxID=5157 RepID=A0A2C5WXK7_9PEZI|nr:hypothetical protein CFIMG_004504RA [Ceratocystis fimbriata CBS 114723]